MITKIKIKFISTIAVVFCLVAIVSIWIVYQDVRMMSQKSTEDSLLMLSSSIEQTLKTSMKFGDAQKVEEALRQARKDSAAKLLTVYKSSQVQELFSISNEMQPDEAAKEVFTKKMQTVAEILNTDGHSLRVLKPFVAQKECLACHKNSVEGSVIGVMDLRLSLDESDKTLKLTLLKLLMIYGLTLAALAFFAIWLTGKLVMRRFEDTLTDKALLEKITAGMGEGLFAMDNNGSIVYCNDMACKILGYERNELLGKNLHETVHHHDKKGNFVPSEECSTLLALRQSSIYTSDDELFFDKNSNPIEVGYTATPMQDKGITQGSVLIFSDNTEKNRIKRQLLLSDKVLQNIEEAVLVTDKNNIIIYANGYFETLTGYSKDEVLGQDPKFIKSGLHDDNFYVSMWDTVDSFGRWKGEIYNRKKNGEIFVEWLGISIVKDDEGHVLYYVAIFSDITVRKQMEEQLKGEKEKFEQQAAIDVLTGAYNRRKFNDFFDFEIERAVRYSTNFSLILFDIDKFKNVNDTFGHLVGDKVLVCIASLASSGIRSSDILARWGGEEFMILAIGTDINGALALAENLREKIENNLFEDVRSVTASFGVASYANGDTIDTLTKKVDDSLYKAKNSGRNKVVVWYENS